MHNAEANEGKKAQPGRMTVQEQQEPEVQHTNTHSHTHTHKWFFFFCSKAIEMKWIAVEESANKAKSATWNRRRNGNGVAPPPPVAKIVLEKLSPCEIDKHEGRKAEKPRRRKLKRSGWVSGTQHKGNLVAWHAFPTAKRFSFRFTPLSHRDFLHLFLQLCIWFAFPAIDR